ncbi:MAG: hypothetical protein GDA48_16320 [Hormoscilla sp. GM102CHS1]|nr:hypothetical protein [Hormoscilla sp. GM102CHS1]
MGIELIKSLKSAGVKFMRVAFCDNANAIRAKAIHLEILAENMDGCIPVLLLENRELRIENRDRGYFPFSIRSSPFAISIT